MPAAAIAGGIGSVAGGVASGKGAKKAAKIQAKSAKAQQKLLKEMYNMNVGNFTPEMNSGNAALSQINQLLGLSPMSTANFNAGYQQGQVPAAPATPSTGFPRAGNKMGAKILAKKYGGSASDYMDNDPATGGGYTPPAPAAPTTPAAPAPSPLDIIRNTPGYAFQLQQGLDAVNANAYAAGMGNSGAALKALQDRGDGLAQQYFNTYMGQLTDVANRGAGAKSSIAGVSQNYANNSNSVAQNAANAASANAFYQGQNIANTIKGVGSSIFGSSFGGGG